MEKRSKKSTTFVVPALKMKDVIVRVVGTTPLLVHNFDGKSLRQMEDIQAQLPKTGKRPKRDPDGEFQRSMYRSAKGEHLFPAGAFRRAMIRTCKLIHGIDMTDAKVMFKMPQEYVRLECTDPEVDVRPVRLKNGSADIRYRALYKKWECDLVIRYNANWADPEQLLNLLLTAGESVGVGEMRPEKGSGSFGCFTIKTGKR